LTIRQGERWKLAFAVRADMDTVWQLLASGSFTPLRADVEWNAKYQQYLEKPQVKNTEGKRELQ
jgi:GH25 family lysozyme M1 (1,4-beta-N-acetylmuramidase)